MLDLQTDRGSMSTLTARLFDHDIQPGSEEWLRYGSASKVAAILGLSNWESEYSLWFKMAGILEPEPQTDEQARGHYLEPAISHWFTDQHPEFQVFKTRPWQHTERTWQTADPDRMLCPAGPKLYVPTAALECKTAADLDTWGPDFSDEYPPGYRAQAMWQMDTIGIRRIYLAVLLPYLQFRQYVIDYDEAEAASHRQRFREFLDTLPGGPNEKRPEIDGHDETYKAVRRMHPDIGVEVYEFPDDDPLADEYKAANAAHKEAEAEKRRLSALVTERARGYRQVKHRGQVIATRVPGRGAGAPPTLRATPVPKTHKKEMAA